MFKKQKKIWVFSILLICFTALLLWLLFIKKPNRSEKNADVWQSVSYANLTNTIGLAGYIEATDRSVLSAPFDGIIKDVMVHDGDEVKKGDVLFTMDTSQLDIQLRKALSEVMKAKREHAILMNWKNTPEVNRIKRQFRTATLVLNNSRTTLEETKKLYERGIVSRDELENLRIQVQSQTEDLNNVKDELSSLESHADSDFLQISLMDLKNAEASFESIQNMASRNNVKAPYDGLILTVIPSGAGSPVIPEKGVLVSQGTPIFSVTQIGKFKVIASVQESDIHLLKKGMGVNISGDGFQGDIFKGNISHISMKTSGESNQSNIIEYDIDVSISEISDTHKIRLGMSANLEILLYENPHGLAVPQEAIRQDEHDKSFVYYRKNSNNLPERKYIQVGKAVSSGIEITGIEPGEILLSDPPPVN